MGGLGALRDVIFCMGNKEFELNYSDRDNLWKPTAQRKLNCNVSPHSDPVGQAFMYNTLLHT